MSGRRSRYRCVVAGRVRGDDAEPDRGSDVRRGERVRVLGGAVDRGARAAPLSQRSHAYSYLVGLFVQVPFVPVSVEFSCGVPEIAGADRVGGFAAGHDDRSRRRRRGRRPVVVGCRDAEPDRVTVLRCGQLVLRAVRSVDRVAAASIGCAAKPAVPVLGRVARPGASLACEHLPDAGGADDPRRRGVGRLRFGRGKTGARGHHGDDERRRGGERGPVWPTTPSCEKGAHLSPLRSLVRGGRALWFLFGARSKPLQMECLHFGRDLLIPFPVPAEDQSRGTELGTDLST